MRRIGQVQRREEGSVRRARRAGEDISAESGVEPQHLLPRVCQGTRVLREAADEGAAGTFSTA